MRSGSSQPPPSPPAGNRRPLSMKVICFSCIRGNTWRITWQTASWINSREYAHAIISSPTLCWLRLVTELPPTWQGVGAGRRRRGGRAGPGWQACRFGAGTRGDATGNGACAADHARPDTSQSGADHRSTLSRRLPACCRQVCLLHRRRHRDTSTSWNTRQGECRHVHMYVAMYCTTSGFTIVIPEFFSVGLVALIFMIFCGFLLEALPFHEACIDMLPPLKPVL